MRCRVGIGRVIVRGFVGCQGVPLLKDAGLLQHGQGVARLGGEGDIEVVVGGSGLIIDPSAGGGAGGLAAVVGHLKDQIGLIGVFPALRIHVKEVAHTDGPLVKVGLDCVPQLLAVVVQVEIVAVGRSVQVNPVQIGGGEAAVLQELVKAVCRGHQLPVGKELLHGVGHGAGGILVAGADGDACVSPPQLAAVGEGKVR